MGLLEYTSSEMFSSTELIRKSKLVFDKLNKNEIEKAIILRDGKPSFMLLDFNKYEELITEYLKLKEHTNKKKITESKNDTVKEEPKQIKEKENIEHLDQINDNDLKDALAQIEQLDFKIDTNTSENDKAEALKEFWD